MAASYGSAVAAAMRSGNYVAAGGDAPAAYADLNETSRQDQARHAALLRRVDAEKRARRIVGPTGDNEVRAMLRKLGHPVRLFGESAADVVVPAVNVATAPRCFPIAAAAEEDELRVTSTNRLRSGAAFWTLAGVSADAWAVE